MDKTENKTAFERWLCTLAGLTDWDDAEAVLEALDANRREMYIQYRTGKLGVEEFRALNVLAGCLEHRTLDSMMDKWDEEAKTERM